MKTFPIEEVRRLFEYDPESGELYWKVARYRKIKPGMRAGADGTRGVVQICINKIMWKAHRLAWAHYYGAWPAGHIDHIDGNPANNAIANLRECTMSQNLANQKKRANNTSGYKGVYRSNYWKHQNKPWTASLRINGKNRFIGRYQTPAEAHVAYKLAAQHHFGEFARGG
jgi:hypothetical protein